MSWFLALILACTPDPVEPTPSEAVAQIPGPAPEPEPLPDPTEPKLAATHVQIAWSGARGASGVERDRDAARDKATSLLAEATARNLETLARSHSDDADGARGGVLGVWRTGAMSLEFERCVSATAVGAIGALCETPFGFQVFRRDPVIEATGVHLSLGWSEALPRERVAEVMEAARTAIAAGGDPAAIGAEQGVVHEPLIEVGRGQLIPVLDQALFALAPGEISPVTEAGERLHLVLRTR